MGRISVRPSPFPVPQQTGTQSTPTLDTIAAIPMAASAKTVLICDDDLGMRASLVVRDDAPLTSPKPATGSEVAISGFAFEPTATT